MYDNHKMRMREKGNHFEYHLITTFDDGPTTIEGLMEHIRYELRQTIADGVVALYMNEMVIDEDFGTPGWPRKKKISFKLNIFNDDDLEEYVQARIKKAQE